MMWLLFAFTPMLGEIREGTLDMCWHGKEEVFHFTTKENEVWFEVRLPDKEPDEGYVVDTRRIIENGKPQSIDFEQLSSIIREKKVLFYTGAGVSIAAGIPSMQGLMSALHLDNLSEAVKDPETLKKNIYAFHEACFHSEPTPAHRALEKIARFKQCGIVTENLDTLHEKSGVDPYRIHPQELRNSPIDIDYIICVGLSHDDRGFLGWYKNQNKEGKIVAIDLGNPNYLGEEDFLIQADLQVLLPSLETSITNGLRSVCSEVP